MSSTIPPASIWRWPEEYAHCLEDLRKTGWREGCGCGEDVLVEEPRCLADFLDVLRKDHRRAAANLPSFAGGRGENARRTPVQWFERISVTAPSSSTIRLRDPSNLMCFGSVIPRLGWPSPRHCGASSPARPSSRPP